MTHTNTTERDALLPCPAGHIALLHKVKRDDDLYPRGWYYVDCVIKNCGWHDGGWSTAEEACNHWNDRDRTANASEASGPTPRVVSQAVLQAAYENRPNGQYGVGTEFVSGWTACLEYLAREVAAPPSDGNASEASADALNGPPMTDECWRAVEELLPATAPPSDRAAVEGEWRSSMCDLLDRLGGDAPSICGNGANPTPQQVSDEIYHLVMSEAERARASDTNAAAARHVAHADNQMPEQNRMRREHENAAAAPVLWCMHVQGPDDVHPAPSKAHAERAASRFNATFKIVSADTGVICKAVVAPWPHSAESHADGVDKFCEEWLTPAPPTPRAAFRQPTIEDASKMLPRLYEKRDESLATALLGALKHIGAVIPADRGEGGAW